MSYPLSITAEWVCGKCGLRFTGGFTIDEMYSPADYYFLVHGEYCYGMLHRTTKEVECTDCFA